MPSILFTFDCCLVKNTHPIKSMQFWSDSEIDMHVVVVIMKLNGTDLYWLNYKIRDRVPTVMESHGKICGHGKVVENNKISKVMEK